MTHEETTNDAELVLTGRKYGGRLLGSLDDKELSWIVQDSGFRESTKEAAGRLLATRREEHGEQVEVRTHPLDRVDPETGQNPWPLTCAAHRWLAGRGNGMQLLWEGMRDHALTVIEEDMRKLMRAVGSSTELAKVLNGRVWGDEETRKRLFGTVGLRRAMVFRWAVRRLAQELSPADPDDAHEKAKRIVERLVEGGARTTIAGGEMLPLGAVLEEITKRGVE